MRPEDYDAILCDLDGCLVSGDVLLPGAEALVRRAGERLTILTNNSTDTPASLSERLAGLGLSVPPARIVLAGTAAIDHLAAQPGVRVRLIGSAVLRCYAFASGLTLAREGATHILLAKDTNFGFADLREAISLLSCGVRLVVTNPDVSYLGPGGVPEPETGSLLAAILSILPGLPYDVIGKPEPALYKAALQRYPTPTNRVLAIGDNPMTDAEGARRLGVDFVLVGSQASVWSGLDRYLESFPTSELPL